MKKSGFMISVIAYIGLSLAFLAPASATDFDFDLGVDNFEFFQHDFEASKGKFTGSARFLSGDTGDYWHGQADIALTDRITIGARFADAAGLTEYRAHASFDAIQSGPFYVRATGSYHYIDGGELIRSIVNQTELDYNGPDSLDYWRFGVRIGAEKAFGENWQVFAWHEPRFVFGGDFGDFEFAGSKSEVGVMRNFERLSVGPFLQYVADDSYEKEWLIAGTKVSATF